jgi:hypothetical protein
MLVVEIPETQETPDLQEMVVHLVTAAAADKKVGLLVTTSVATLVIMKGVIMFATPTMVLNVEETLVAAVVLVETQAAMSTAAAAAAGIVMAVMVEMLPKVLEAAVAVAVLLQEIQEPQATQVLEALQTPAIQVLQQHLALHQTFQPHHKQVIQFPSHLADL